MKEKDYLNMIYYIYTSKESVFTIIHQYLYQTIVLNDEYLIKNLKEFILLELDHLELLGKYIYKNNELPIFALKDQNKEKYWHTNTFYYDADLPTIITINKEMLEKNLSNLQMLINIVKDSELKRIIKTIIHNEYKELKYFNNLTN